MNRYILYCTEEQTKKALELGAPIKDCEYNDDTPTIFIGWHPNEKEYKIPTAEQMIGWLEEQEIHIAIYWFSGSFAYDLNSISYNSKYSTRTDATLAAIDVALEYLANNNLIK